MSKYNELELQAFVDAVDRAYEARDKLDGHHIRDILVEASHLLELLQEPLTANNASTLAFYAEELESNTDKVDELKGRIDVFLEMIDEGSWEADGNDLKAWLDSNSKREMVLIPENMAREDALASFEVFLEKLQNEANGDEKSSEDPA